MSLVGNIWEGIYENFAEVPTSGNGHHGNQWVTRSLEKIRQLIVEARRVPIPGVPIYGTSPLPVIAALVLNERGKVTILDFGGGLGFTYVPVAAAVADSNNLEYHIVETEPMCDAGEEFFGQDPRIHFHPSLPTKIVGADIVHLGSSLQYIDDWRGLLKNLARYRPIYFMFTDLTAGDIPSFVTAQNYYGAKIPARFFNIGEIHDAMGENGFKLVFRSTFKGTYFGVAQRLPQDNFPERFRLENTCSLVFGRSG